MSFVLGSRYRGSGRYGSVDGYAGGGVARLSSGSGACSSPLRCGVRGVPARRRCFDASWGLRMVGVFFVLAVAQQLGASHHLPNESDPDIPHGVIELHTHARLFYALGPVSAMLEYVGRFEDAETEFRYQSVTAGAYHRIHRNVKAGVFYRLQFNARHHDDWIESGATWVWADAAGRAEHLLMADVTPRFQLDFLPGRNWVGDVKARYAFNFHNLQHTLLLRPGLTFFWMKDRTPILNISARYATYLSLNFGVVPWYRHGPYLNILYHLSSNILIDVGFSRQWVYWSESREFLADFPEAAYEENVYSPWAIDIGFVVKL